MIKNVIFDFGNILINFDARRIAANFTSDIEEQDFLIENCVHSPEWVSYGLIDSGFISFPEAAILINDRTNHVKEELVTNFMKNYTDYMEISSEVVEFIKQLKNKGYKIYMLSNTSEPIYNLFIKNIEYLFDGLVLSYKIHMVKPNDSIYKYLLNEYKLNPEESLFIDDRYNKNEKANQFGIKGRRVEPDNVKDIELVLKEYNLL